MSNRTALLHKRLLEEGAKTAAYFRSLSPAELEQAIYTAGPGWRARDLLTHLISTEHNIRGLIVSLLAGGPGAPDGFDIDAFNAAATAGPAGDCEVQVRDFETARAATAELAAGLSDADLDRRGRHPFLGDAPIEDMLKLLYRHTMLHERDARKALTSGAPLAGGG